MGHIRLAVAINNNDTIIVQLRPQKVKDNGGFSTPL